jgi:PAS domain S-box-containing protein
MSSNQNFIRKNILNSIQGRLILFSSVFVLALIFIPAIIYVRSTENAHSIQNIEEVRLPLSLLTSRLLSEVNNTGSSQKAYIITKKPVFKKERLDTWAKSIYPLLDTLNTYRKNKEAKDIIGELEKATKFINEYENIERKIDNFFEDNFDAFNLSVEANDSLSAEKVIESIRLRNQLDAQIGEMMSHAEEIRVKIQKALLPITASQEAQLQVEITGIGKSIRFSILVILLISILLIFSIVIFSYFILRSLQKSIRKPINLLNKLSQGEIVQSEELTNDELDEVILASNKLSQNLQKASEFAQSIGEANFETEFELENEKDLLGNALLQMRHKLKEVAEDDRKRSWVSEGLTRFGDIIRTNSNSFEELGDVFLSELIEYVGANQGGIFIVREEDEYSEYIASLELIAYYAYNRKKYQNKIIKVHPHYAENLVGQTYLEKEKIYLKEIPNNYINITSGLGDAPPSHLLLIPFKINDQVEGVLELASFDEFELHQIQFIETIGETFASTIVAVKGTERTQNLLNTLQEKTESLQAQEEEMRQNMEELTVTQEQMQLKQTELENLKATLEVEVNRRTKELNESLSRFNLINESSSDGLWDMVVPADGIIKGDTYFYWSPQLRKLLGYDESAFPNKLASWFDILYHEDLEKVSRAFIAFIKDKTNQIQFREEHRLRLKDGSHKWFLASAQVLRDKKGNAIRVAGYINNITVSKDLAKVLEELKTQKQALEQKQIELEATNEKMCGNEMVLKKVIDKNKEKEQELALNHKLLSETKDRFEMIIDNAPGVLYQFEANLTLKTGKYVFITDYIEKTLGYSKEEFLGADQVYLDSLLHLEEKQEFYQNYTYALINLSQFDWEGRMLAKDKTWKWIKVNSTPYQKGKIVLFNGILTDVTLRRQQEDKLKTLNDNLKKSEDELRFNLIKLHQAQQEMGNKNTELEEMNQKTLANEKILIKGLQSVREKEHQLKYKQEEMQSVLDSSADSIFTINSQGVIQSVNLRAEKTFGYSKAELINKNISDMFPELESYFKENQKVEIKKDTLKAIRKDNTNFEVIAIISEIKVLHDKLYTAFFREK